MWSVVEFAIRLSLRFGALVGFVLLGVALVAALIAMMRLGFKPSASNAIWWGCAAIAVIGLFLTVSAAREGASHLGRAFAGLGAETPTPSGPYRVADTILSLAPLRGSEGAPIEVRVWYPDVAAPAQTRRLILHAPGIGGDRDQISYTLANLASHGYIVLAFDDMAHDPAPADETEAARFMREGPNDFSSPEGYDATLAASDTRVAVQAHKARDILDRFSAIANGADTPWHGHVDVRQVGFLGFSFGGATAAETALIDQRIAAVVNFDGALFNRAAQGPVQAPYLLIMSDMRRRLAAPDSWRRSQEYRLDDRERAAAAVQARQPHSEVMEVRFAEHAMFEDDYFKRGHLRQWLMVDPQRAYDIVQARVLPFFATYLPMSEATADAAPRQHFEEVLELGGPA